MNVQNRAQNHLSRCRSRKNFLRIPFELVSESWDGVRDLNIYEGQSNLHFLSPVGKSREQRPYPDQEKELNQIPDYLTDKTMNPS
jgi:hypothetical protein